MFVVDVFVVDNDEALDSDVGKEPTTKQKNKQKKKKMFIKGKRDGINREGGRKDRRRWNKKLQKQFVESKGLIKLFKMSKEMFEYHVHGR